MGPLCLRLFILLLHLLEQVDGKNRKEARNPSVFACLFCSYIYWSNLMTKIGNRQATSLSLSVYGRPTAPTLS